MDQIVRCRIIAAAIDSMVVHLDSVSGAQIRRKEGVNGPQGAVRPPVVVVYGLAVSTAGNRVGKLDRSLWDTDASSRLRELSRPLNTPSTMLKVERYLSHRVLTNMSIIESFADSQHCVS